MQEEHLLTPEERETESALGRLRPADVSAQRDSTMFRAGQASMSRRGTFWQGATAVLAAGLCISLVTRPAPTRPGHRGPVGDERVDSASETRNGPGGAERGSRSVTDRNTYLAWRNEILTLGVDALDTTEALARTGLPSSEPVQSPTRSPRPTPTWRGARALTEQGEHL
jgi:hypothetical protein